MSRSTSNDPRVRLDAPDYDLSALRAEFPALAQTINGHPLVYLDNAATSQKPRAVIDAVVSIYERNCANVHRGVHTLSQRATDQYESCRETVRAFIGAGSTKEIVFVRGATEGINLVAQSFARPRLGQGDEILITHLEHHSNIVPWQLLCSQTGARLVVAPIEDDGSVELEGFARLVTARTRMAAFAHVSNALGTILPVRELTALCRERGVPTLIDGAQAAPHVEIDVDAIGCDFYVFSAHKAYGPTGAGVLWGRRAHLEAMPPWQGGGDMIASVSFEGSKWNSVPHKFEAGTPAIADVVGMGAALDWLQGVGVHRVASWEEKLAAVAAERLREIDGLRLIGTAERKAGVVSFVLESAHPHDIGTILDQLGIAIRAGHHCAEPVMRRFGVPATARASFAAYNTLDEVDALVGAVEKVREMFGDV